MSLDLREMSFQNVLDEILKPAGVKVGGFPQEIFQDLKDDEKEKWSCNICYQIVNECRQCDNKHYYCSTCIFAWSLTFGENSQKCPLCRCEQREYAENREINRNVQDKRVHCPEDNCTFKSPLKIFLMHSHGKLRFSNAHVNLESLRPARPPGSRLLVLPAFAMLGEGSNRLQRRFMLRSQLQQGRTMIHQMMMLLHLEMQLRQQALVSYQETSEPTVRLQRLDEVLALNEQLNEVGTILSNLLSTPLSNNNTTQAEDTANSSETTSNEERGIGQTTTSSDSTVGNNRPTVRNIHSIFNDTDTEDDGHDSDSSDTSSDASSVILNTTRPSNTNNAQQTTAMSSSNPVSTTRSLLNRSQVTRLGGTLQEGQAAIDRARERRDASQILLGNRPDPRTERNIQTRDIEQSVPVAQQRTASQSRNTSLLHQRQAPEPNSLLLQNSVSESVTTESNVGQIREARPNSVARRSHSRTTESFHLPTLQAATPREPSPAISDGSRISSSSGATVTTGSANPTAAIPAGSAALRNVMQDLGHFVTPNTSGNRISVTMNPPTRAPTRTTGNVDNATIIEQTGSGARHRTSEINGISQDTQGTSDTVHTTTSTESNGPANRGGSILPASLYRRRSRPDSSLTDRTNSPGIADSNTPISNSQAQRAQGSQSLPKRNTGPSQMTRARMARPILNTSRSTELRQRVPVNSTSQSITTNRHTGSVQQRQLGSNGSMSHDNHPSERAVQHKKALSKTRQGANHAQTSETNGSGTKGLPTMPGGVVRSRRRSEIHQQLLMRKDNH